MFIDSFPVTITGGDINDLKVKILFSNTKLETPDFSSAEENYVLDFLVDDILSITIPNKLSINNLYVYLYFYDLTGSFFTSYEKIFFQELISNGQVVASNFIDLRIENSNSVVQEVLDEKQILEQAYMNVQQDLFKQQFISDLFYSVQHNNQVNLFFGVDQEGYFKKNNFISFLDQDPDFNSYLSNNNFITSIESYIYNSRDHYRVEPESISVGLKYLFGDMYQTNFQVTGELYKTENYGYNTTCRLKNAIVEYCINELLPILKEESDFLLSLKLSNNAYEYIQREQVAKTIDILKSILLENSSDLGDIFTIYDSSEQLLVNSDLVNFILLVNKNIIEIITKNLNSERLTSSDVITLSKDFGKTIDLKDIKIATEVHGFGVGINSLTTVTLAQYAERANKELTKYFNSPNTILIGKSGPVEVDLVSLSYGYLTGLTNTVNKKQALDNTKSVNFDFSYDDYLDYVSAIDKIVSQKINYDFKIANQPDRDWETC